MGSPYLLIISVLFIAYGVTIIMDVDFVMRGMKKKYTQESVNNFRPWGGAAQIIFGIGIANIGLTFTGILNYIFLGFEVIGIVLYIVASKKILVYKRDWRNHKNKR